MAPDLSCAERTILNLIMFRVNGGTVWVFMVQKISAYGLRLAKSGGDGLMIGEGALPYCSDILVQDVVCDSNYRQGISVTSAKNLTIQCTRVTNTFGTPPQAGIDFEPDKPHHSLVNCRLENCYFYGNRYYGIVISLISYNQQSSPVSFVIQDCRTSGNSEDGRAMLAIAIVGPSPEQGVASGTISLTNNTLEGLQLGNTGNILISLAVPAMK